MTENSISIIIPAFDEAGRIFPTLKRIDAWFSASGMDYEIVVVDDGSRDDTREVVLCASAEIPALRLVENGVNRGKGYSVKNGFLNSSGRFVLFSDADLSTPVEETDKLMAEMAKGADIAIGSRAVSGADIVKRQPVYRMLMGKTFNKIVRLLAVRGFSDTQCGFKLFRRSSCERIFRAQRTERFAFDVELLFLAVKAGLKISEVPVRWINSPQSKVHPINDSLNMLVDLSKMRWNYISGRYSGF
jgi:dolichyl-phosphate beta-glucosyltransferase